MVMKHPNVSVLWQKNHCLKLIILIVLLSALALEPKVSYAESLKEQPDTQPIELPLNVLWQRSIPFQSNNRIDKIHILQDESLFLSGLLNSKPWNARFTNDGSPFWERHNIESRVSCVTTDFMYLGDTQTVSHGELIYPSADFLISKINNSGKIIWQKTFGDSSHEIITDIACQTNNELYAVGTAGEKTLLVKFDNNGLEQWKKYFASNAGAAVFPIDPKKILVVAESAENNDRLNNNHGTIAAWIFDDEGKQKGSEKVIIRTPFTFRLSCCWDFHFANSAESGNIKYLSSTWRHPDFDTPLSITRFDEDFNIVWQKNISLSEPLTITPHQKNISISTLLNGDAIIPLPDTSGNIVLYRFNSTNGSIITYSITNTFLKSDSSKYVSSNNVHLVVNKDKLYLAGISVDIEKRKKIVWIATTKIKQFSY